MGHSSHPLAPAQVDDCVLDSLPGTVHATSSEESITTNNDSPATSVFHTPSVQPTVSGISEQILEIIFDYALNKFSDTKQRLEAGRPKFLSVIDGFVVAQKRVEMCLPAFPFKSANKVYKVLGNLPDKAEELALSRLNTMCIRIEEIYEPGARCTIISDGLVYNGTILHFPHLLRYLDAILIISRFAQHFGSRYMGLRPRCSSYGCGEGIRPHWFLSAS